MNKVSEKIRLIDEYVGQIGEVLVIDHEKIEALKDALLENYITDTATGAIASFPDGADGIPVKDLKVAIEPVQSGSGDPSPTNIRPISGWNGGEVYVRGTNIWDEEWELGYLNANTGANANSNNCIRSKNYIAVKPSTSYYVKGIAQLALFYYDKDKTYITKEFRQNTVINVPDTCAYIRFYMPDAYGTTYNHDISINYPSTDHDYHAYNGNTYPITWQTEAGTVYKGYINPITGVLTVKWAAYAFKGTETWEPHATVANYYFCAQTPNPSLPLNQFKVFGDGSGFDGKPYSSHYKGVAYVNSAQMADGETTTYSGAKGKTIGVKSSTIADATAMQAYCLAQYNAGTPVTVVLPLVTPTTVQLTPTEVSTVLGQNSIWADCGDVDVEYRADTKLYIQKVIA